MTIVALAVLGGAGGALAGLSPDSAAVAVGCLVAVSAGVLLAAESSLGILAETLAAFLGAGLVTGAPAGFLLGYSFGFVGLWATGMTRRAYVLSAEQAELMLAETRRAREAETHAAALAERARIARDIHDVLAHSLAAVSVNLQAAAGLLGSETLPADNPELARAIECVGRAAALTKRASRRLAGPCWPCATRPRRCPISCRRWPASTPRPATRRSSSRSPARCGRFPPRPAWPPTGPRRRR